MSPSVQESLSYYLAGKVISETESLPTSHRLRQIIYLPRKHEAYQIPQTASQTGDLHSQAGLPPNEIASPLQFTLPETLLLA